MIKNIWFFISILMASNIVLGAEVIKLSKNKIGMAITHEFGSPWEIGQKVCVKGKNGENYCGKVVKVQEAGAICQMSEPLKGIAPGDEVTSADDVLSTGKAIENPLDSSETQESNGSNSQESSPKKSGRRKFGLGFRGGVVFGNISSSTDSTTGIETRTLINLGITFDIPLGRGIVSLEPSFNFTQKGYSNKLTASKDKLNYLELPVLLKVRLSRKNFSPFFYAGPYLGYLLAASRTVEGFEGLTAEYDLKDAINSLDFGLMAGLGFDVRVSSKFEIGVSGNYGLGLANIDKDINSSVKNRTIQVLLHFLFQL